MIKLSKGFFLIVLAGLIFGSMGVLVRYISPHVTPFSQVLIRVAFAFIMSLLLISKGRDFFKITKKDLLIYGLGGVLGHATVLILFTLSIINTTIANAFFLLYTEPFFAAVFAYMFLREKITKQLLIALIISFIGIFLIFNPSNLNQNLLGNIYGLGAGILYGFYIFLGRIVGKKYSSSKNTLWVFTFSLLFLIPATLSVEKPFSLSIPFYVWVLLFLFGLANVSAYSLLNAGLSKIKAGYAGVLLLLAPTSAVFYAIVFFKEYPKLNTILGAILIISSIVFLTFSKFKLKKT